MSVFLGPGRATLAVVITLVQVFGVVADVTAVQRDAFDAAEEEGDT